MAKKKAGIIDSFVFRRAKQAVDDLTKSDLESQQKSMIISGLYQDQRNTISPSEQDQNKTRTTTGQYHITKEPDTDHVQNRSIPVTQQVKGALKEQDHINTKAKPKISLSARQSQIYLWFKNKGKTGIFNKGLIQQQLGIPYISIRKAVQKLQICGILELNYDTCQKVYEYKLNEKIEVKLISKGAGSYQEQNRSFSSSSKIITTTKNIDLQNFLASDPRSLYWKDKGLTAKQIENWVKETQMSVEDIIQSLEHCWFEMVHLRKEEKKDIRDVLSWFYKTVRRAGFYPPPKGFKPYEEVRAEEMARARKKRETAIEKLQEEARKEYELKKETEFWEMMADQESDKYKKCFQKLNNFSKQLKGGPTFEKAMRKAFDELFLGEG